MKFPPKARLGILITMVGVSCWALGYVQGNASGSRRIAIAGFMMHTATLQRFEEGDLNRARLYTTMFVRAGDNYLHADPFWWTALKEVFSVNNEGMFVRELPLARNRVQWASNAPKIQVSGEASPNKNEER